MQVKEHSISSTADTCLLGLTWEHFPFMDLWQFSSLMEIRSEQGHCGHRLLTPRGHSLCPRAAGYGSRSQTGGSRCGVCSEEMLGFSKWSYQLMFSPTECSNSGCFSSLNKQILCFVCHSPGYTEWNLAFVSACASLRGNGTDRILT